MWSAISGNEKDANAVTQTGICGGCVINHN